MQFTGCFIGTTVITGCQALCISAMGSNNHCPLLFHFVMCALPHPSPCSSGSPRGPAAHLSVPPSPVPNRGTHPYQLLLALERLWTEQTATPWPGPCRHRAATNFYGRETPQNRSSQESLPVPRFAQLILHKLNPVHLA